MRFRQIALIPLTMLFCEQSLFAQTDPWWDTEWKARAKITVDPGTFVRVNKPVEVSINFTTLLGQISLSGALDDDHLRVVETNATGTVIDASVAFQFDKDTTYDATTKALGILVLIAKDTTTASTPRTFYVYFDVEANIAGKTAFAPAARIALDTVSDHEGYESYKITCGNVTYYYHKAGGGFASMDDAQGNDWIGYRPLPCSGPEGANGCYRGIPNLHWPADLFHPGKTNCTSKIAYAGSLRVRITSVTNDDKWLTHWDMYSDHANLTVERMNPDSSFWFLYEGTPGGSLEPTTDYWVISNGTRKTCNFNQNADIASPEWMYFGDNNMKRTIFLAHREDDSHIDKFYQMNNQMTVFGFGRSDLNKLMNTVPQHFSIGLFEDSTYADLSVFIRSAVETVAVTIAAAEKNDVITPPTIVLNAPDSGEIWIKATRQNVQWQAADDNGIAYREIYWKQGSAGSWVRLDSAAGATGTRMWAWTLPDAVIDSAWVYVLVANAAGSTATDTSRYPFRIIAPPVPTCSLIAPDSLETWIANSQENIQWHSTDVLGMASRAIYWKNGASGTWALLDSAVGTAGNASWAWTLPGQTTDAAWVYVRVVNTTGNEASDTTDFPFRIVLAPYFTSKTIDTAMVGSTYTYNFAYQNPVGGTAQVTVLSNPPWTQTGLNLVSGTPTAVGIDTIRGFLAVGAFRDTITVTVVSVLPPDGLRSQAAKNSIAQLDILPHRSTNGIPVFHVIAEAGKAFHLEIRDAAGRLVWQACPKASNRTVHKMVAGKNMHDKGRWQSGVYFAIVTQGSERAVRRFQMVP